MSEQSEKLIEEYTADYMEKVFYFCLKKCGSADAAEDLASDISLNVITSLEKGVEPRKFSAWVWRIARNRYAAFAERKHKDSLHVVSMEGLDGVSELPDECLLEDDYVEGAMLRDNLHAMRRELAFIREDYRNIILAYYIEDRKVEEIAARMGIPKGTVTSKLFRSRKLLKEGMNMAREFGKRSYKPENIGFIMDGRDGKNGEPYSIVNRLICKNIVLSAYDKALTAEEIAIEIGVALPYTQAELDGLVEATLMKKVGDRYATRFYIVSAEVQAKIFENLERITPQLTAKMIELLEFKLKCWEENGVRWHEGYQCFEDMKWALLMKTVDSIQTTDPGEFTGLAEDESQLDGEGALKRPNGGSWDLVGFETYDWKQPFFVGCHGCLGEESYEVEAVCPSQFWQYKFYYGGIYSQTPEYLSPELGRALAAVAKGAGDGIPEHILNRLVEYGYVRCDEERYVPTIYVYSGDNIGALSEGQQEEYDRISDEVRGMMDGHNRYCCEQILADVPETMTDEAHLVNYACRALPVEMRGAVLEEALRCGYLSYHNQPDEGKKRALGAYMKI
ncbi:MAG: RNA polymerase sigma factor [Clostridia bacterium]|nr:RNA polymerase sigma factor [Clostridia bacterium]